MLLMDCPSLKEPPFKHSDHVAWNTRYIHPDTLDRLKKTYGEGPFVVDSANFGPDNFTGSITVKSGKKFVYSTRPKDAKKGTPIRSLRAWNWHNFIKIQIITEPANSPAH